MLSPTCDGGSPMMGQSFPFHGCMQVAVCAPPAKEADPATTNPAATHFIRPRCCCRGWWLLPPAPRRRRLPPCLHPSPAAVSSMPQPLVIAAVAAACRHRPYRCYVPPPAAAAPRRWLLRLAAAVLAGAVQPPPAPGHHHWPVVQGRPRLEVGSSPECSEQMAPGRIIVKSRRRVWPGELLKASASI